MTSRSGRDARSWPTRSTTTHRNPEYLGDVELPTSIRATSDSAEALAARARFCLRCRRRRFGPISPTGPALLGDDVTLVSLAKGIELDTLMRMSQVVIQVTGADPSRVAVVTGPNLASEIAEEQPAATVVACADSGRAVTLQRALSTKYFRPYTNADVIGAEVGGACKNVIALACGMAAGVGMGENSVAAIITRGLAEIMRLGIALGAKPATLAGLAGVGDLVATCTSPHSRNRTFGARLGTGDSLEAAKLAARRTRRRGRHIVRIGVGARGQLRRRDAVDRRGPSGVPQGIVRARSGRAAARPQHQTGVTRWRPVRRLHAECQSLGAEAVPGAPVAPPPVPAAAYHIPPSEDDSLDSYGRYHNPTWRQLESALAELEGATAALTFGSGMAAITSVAAGAHQTGMPRSWCPLTAITRCAAMRSNTLRRRASP